MPDLGASGQQANQASGSASNSGLTRLKRERAQYQDYIATMDKRMASLEQKLEQALASQGQQANSNDPSSWSLSDLETYATREDVIQESPQAANQALLYANKRMIQDAVNELRQELRNEVTGTLTRKQEVDTVRQSISRDFGDVAWDPESQLYQEADVIYRQYQNKFGRPGEDGQVELDPYYLRTAFLEAQKVLEARAGQEALRANTPMEEALRAPQGPPPQDRVEGMGEGVADALAARHKAIEAGDVRSAFQSVARELYPT